jgi:hypothetical protein
MIIFIASELESLVLSLQDSVIVMASELLLFANMEAGFSRVY